MAKILVVDDNEMNMRLFSDLLRAKGHDVIECLDGTKALDLAKKHLPDLILMDIQMPEISGLAVTKLIRKTPTISNTKIVAVSAFAMNSDRERILAAGCNAYIPKPIDIPSFFATVDTNLAVSA